jgi:hypothetical protein
MLNVFFWVAGDVGSVYFGPNHPMKPHRLCMTHHLILAYGLHSKMEVYVSVSCSSYMFLVFVLDPFILFVYDITVHLD